MVEDLARLVCRLSMEEYVIIYVQQGEVSEVRGSTHPSLIVI